MAGPRGPSFKAKYVSVKQLHIVFAHSKDLEAVESVVIYHFSKLPPPTLDGTRAQRTQLLNLVAPRVDNSLSGLGTLASCAWRDVELHCARPLGAEHLLRADTRREGPYPPPPLAVELVFLLLHRPLEHLRLALGVPDLLRFELLVQVPVVHLGGPGDLADLLHRHLAPNSLHGQLQAVHLAVRIQSLAVACDSPPTAPSGQPCSYTEIGWMGAHKPSYLTPASGA
jgi:hypothetical protein